MTTNGLQLRAELDAAFAHLYGVSEDDFAYMLSTFPAAGQTLSRRPARPTARWQPGRRRHSRFVRGRVQAGP